MRQLRSEERFSRNAETDIVCRLLLEKKKKRRSRGTGAMLGERAGATAGGARAARRISLPHPRLRRRASIIVTFSVGGTDFFFNDTATPEIYTLSLHDALPIYGKGKIKLPINEPARSKRKSQIEEYLRLLDRKSGSAGMPRPISYAVLRLE